MRRLRYNVAMSLDGFIATSEGAYDWIVDDSTIDMAGLFSEFDTFVMGRGTYEIMLAQGDQNPLKGSRVFVVSSTLSPADHPDVQILGRDFVSRIAAMKSEPGKDIWLFGGGQLFRTLLDEGLVDSIELAVMPVLIGSGIPVIPPGRHARLQFAKSVSYPSGIQILNYTCSPRIPL